MISMYMGFFGPVLWTPKPNWHDMFVHRVFWSNVVDTQPNWHNIYVHGVFWSSVVDTQA